MTSRTRRPSSSKARQRVAVRSANRSRLDSRVGLLVVVDATEASTRVLRYIGTILKQHNRVNVHLAYIAPRVPAELMESGGSELPEREEQLEAALSLAWCTLAANASSKAGIFDSELIAPDKSWKFTARKKGDFPYVCTYHPTMKAVLHVKWRSR